MSERKVLNKYYPPDFDPSKIPRIKLAKNRQYTVRLMAPFNMRCKTCGEYIYKGKKFNARKEDVESETYLGIRIYRFYIKCTRCLQEISFKTDPQNTDYEIEAGATRNFMALKLAEEQARKEENDIREEEANNPMKLLENRTKQSRNEIDLLESLEELRDLNRRHQTVDYGVMLQQYEKKDPEQIRIEQEKEDEEEFNALTLRNKRRKIDETIANEELKTCFDDDSSVNQKLNQVNETSTNQSTSNSVQATRSKSTFSIGGLSTSRKSLASMVTRKPITKSNVINTQNPQDNKKCTTDDKKEISSKETVVVKPIIGLCSAYSDSSDENEDN